MTRVADRSRAKRFWGVLNESLDESGKVDGGVGSDARGRRV